MNTSILKQLCLLVVCLCKIFISDYVERMYPIEVGRIRITQQMQLSLSHIFGLYLEIDNMGR